MATPEKDMLQKRIPSAVGITVMVGQDTQKTRICGSKPGKKSAGLLRESFPASDHVRGGHSAQFWRASFRPHDVQSNHESALPSMIQRAGNFGRPACYGD
jgi:hypothetical protein